MRLAFWNRKKTEEEPPKAPVILDSANWHEWEAGAKKALNKGDFVHAIEFYKQAVDRFEGTDRELDRLVGRIAADIVTYTKFIAANGHAVPVHLMTRLRGRGRPSCSVSPPPAPCSDTSGSPAT